MGCDVVWRLLLTFRPCQFRTLQGIGGRDFSGIGHKGLALSMSPLRDLCPSEANQIGLAPR